MYFTRREAICMAYTCALSVCCADVEAEHDLVDLANEFEFTRSKLQWGYYVAADDLVVTSSSDDVSLLYASGGVHEGEASAIEGALASALVRARRGNGKAGVVDVSLSPDREYVLLECAQYSAGPRGCIIEPVRGGRRPPEMDPPYSGTDVWWPDSRTVSYFATSKRGSWITKRRADDAATAPKAAYVDIRDLNLGHIQDIILRPTLAAITGSGRGIILRWRKRTDNAVRIYDVDAVRGLAPTVVRSVAVPKGGIWCECAVSRDGAKLAALVYVAAKPVDGAPAGLRSSLELWAGALGGEMRRIGAAAVRTLYEPGGGLGENAPTDLAWSADGARVVFRRSNSLWCVPFAGT